MGTAIAYQSGSTQHNIESNNIYINIGIAEKVAKGKIKKRQFTSGRWGGGMGRQASGQGLSSTIWRLKRREYGTVLAAWPSADMENRKLAGVNEEDIMKTSRAISRSLAKERI